MATANETRNTDSVSGHTKLTLPTEEVLLAIAVALKDIGDAIRTSATHGSEPKRHQASCGPAARRRVH